MNTEALERAIRFIEYRPRSGGETRDRLKRWGYSVTDTNEVVAHLTECGLIDDNEFTRLFVAEMIGKGFGYHRVRGELFKKRLDRQVIDAVLDEYPTDEELNRAVSLAQRVAQRLGESAKPENRNKILGYLTRRGYSGGVAAEAYRIAIDVDTNIGPE